MLSGILSHVQLPVCNLVLLNPTKYSAFHKNAKKAFTKRAFCKRAEALWKGGLECGAGIGKSDLG